jgi:signal transduction histidine kinase
MAPFRSPWITRAIRPIGRIAAAALVLGTLLAGLPPGGRRWAVLVVLVVEIALLLVAVSGRIGSRVVLGVIMVLSGLGGAGLDLLQSNGPGLLGAYVAMAGIGLALAPRAAAAAGGIVLVAAAGAEAHVSDEPVSAVLNVTLGALFLFATAGFAAVSRDAQTRAEQLAAEEQALRREREQSAVLAERARMARELHDILAHTLSGLTLQLAGTTLLAQQTGADPRLTTQLESAHRMAKDGAANARGVVAALRGDTLPGPDALPALVAETRLATGLPITFAVTGEPRRLAPEAGLAIYRTAQEALTNIAKHAGRGAEVKIDLEYGTDEVTLVVQNSAGDREPSLGIGFGLTGLAERAALHGGHLEHGPTESGWRVALTINSEVAAR